jgi:hypothetical protein
LLKAVAATANPTSVSPQATAIATQTDRYAACFKLVLARIHCSHALTNSSEPLDHHGQPECLLFTICYLMSCLRNRPNSAMNGQRIVLRSSTFGGLMSPQKHQLFRSNVARTRAKDIHHFDANSAVELSAFGPSPSHIFGKPASLHNA